MKKIRPAKLLTSVCIAAAATLSLLIAAPSVFSQDLSPAPAAQNETYTVYIKFVSSRSGAAVTPTLISIHNAADSPPAHRVTPKSALVPVQLPEGRHSINVEAKGYHSMKADLTVTAGDNPVMTFELDPTGTEEPQPVPDSLAIVDGHVTDSETGELLEQVTLTLPASSLTTTTDSSGHYEFQVTVPPASESAQPAVTLEAKAEGYVPLRIRNLSLAAGQRRHMPLALERTTSDTLAGDIRESDESRTAGNHRSYNWVFDATIR